jgi:hypothetical protein
MNPTRKMIPSLEIYASNSDDGDPIPSEPSESPDPLTDDGEHIDGDGEHMDGDGEHVDRDGEVIPLSAVLP